MITPTICTIVASRNAQSSVSYADANQEIVNPRPANREDCQAEARETGGEVALGQQVGKLFAGHTKRHDKGEVIQQLKRRRRPVRLIRIAARHHSKAVRPCQFRSGHRQRPIR